MIKLYIKGSKKGALLSTRDIVLNNVFIRKGHYYYSYDEEFIELFEKYLEQQEKKLKRIN